MLDKKCGINQYILFQTTILQLEYCTKLQAHKIQAGAPLVLTLQLQQCPELPQVDEESCKEIYTAPRNKLSPSAAASAKQMCL